MAKDRKVSLFNIRTDIGVLITLATVLGLVMYSTFFMEHVPYSSGVVHSFQPKFVVLVITSILYLVVGGGFGLLFMLSFCQIQKAKLFWAIISCYIFVTAWFGAVPLHGRYLDPVFILLFILGLVSVKTMTQRNSKDTLSYRLLFIAFAISVLSVVFALALRRDLVNVATIGFSHLPQIYLFGGVFSTFVLILFFMKKTESVKKLTYVSVILFLLILGAVFVYNDVKAVQYIYTHTNIDYEESSMGRWISEHDISTLYFDIDDYRGLWTSFYISQFWYHKDYIRILNLSQNIKPNSNTPFYLITTKYPEDLQNYKVKLLRVERVRVPYSNNFTSLFLYEIV